MRRWIERLLGRQSQYRPIPPPQAPTLLLTEYCLATWMECLGPEIAKGHEGIAYLFGQTDGRKTLVVSSMRPIAVTTRGSFQVDSASMALVVRRAARLGLQVVGQVHSHPGAAYHSDGDNAGAGIRYTGFVSVVVPNYGRLLPSLEKSASYMFVAEEGFIPIDAGQITIIPGRA